jgi:hypothetical protein
MPDATEIMEEIKGVAADVKALTAKVDRLLDQPVPVAASMSEMSANGTPVKIMELDVEALSVSLNLQNEKAYKLKGHPFKKFGIAVYNDGNRFQDMGIDPESEFGEHPYSQRVVVQMSDPDEEGKSKPLKVLRIAQ